MTYEDLRSTLANHGWGENPWDTLRGIAEQIRRNPSVGRDLVIRALSLRDSLPHELLSVLHDLTLSVGLYPYVRDEDFEHISAPGRWQHAAHRADGQMSSYVLHRSQALVYQKLLDGRSVILSAPTSYGKSLLVDAIIAAKDFANVVLVVPTIALIEETRRRMSRFAGQYQIITTSSQQPGERNIFVATQERLAALWNLIPSVDFFVIDEFYKLSLASDGARSTALNAVFRRLVDTGAQFYLLGPAIHNVAPEALARLDCDFVREDFQTVSIDTHKLKKRPNKPAALAAALRSASGPSLIYCQSPASTRRLLRELLAHEVLPPTSDAELLDAAAWTSKNYHSDWLVSQGLRYRIGVHHGRIPRALGRFMVRAFEERKLPILLCTSTLIEGVNTSARNVFVYDNKIGSSKLDFFTFNNIRGRSGRMFKHFVGNVFVFDDPPQAELPFVDVPAFNPTENTPSSLLMELPPEQLPEPARQRIAPIKNQTLLPVELLREHNGIEPEFLIEAAGRIAAMGPDGRVDLQWSRVPTYDQLKSTSELIWGPLGGRSSASRAGLRSPSMMTFWTHSLSVLRDVRAFRRERIAGQIDYGNDPDEAVEQVLSFLRNWAGFNYPKYLRALSAIVNHVSMERGERGAEYNPFATMIENLFQPSTFSALEEHGLPSEISARFVREGRISPDDDFDGVVRRLRGQDLQRAARGAFEQGVLRDFSEGLG